LPADADAFEFETDVPAAIATRIEVCPLLADPLRQLIRRRLTSPNVDLRWMVAEFTLAQRVLTRHLANKGAALRFPVIAVSTRLTQTGLIFAVIIVLMRMLMLRLGHDPLDSSDGFRYAPSITREP
jgi:hypothetical protein